MVSKLSKEHDRRTGLSHYLYGVSNLVLSGTGIGGLSPLVTGGEIAVFNYLCLAFVHYLLLCSPMQQTK